MCLSVFVTQCLLYFIFSLCLYVSAFASVCPQCLFVTMPACWLCISVQCFCVPQCLYPCLCALVFFCVSWYLWKESACPSDCIPTSISSSVYVFFCPHVPMPVCSSVGVNVCMFQCLCVPVTVFQSKHVAVCLCVLVFCALYCLYSGFCVFGSEYLNVCMFH